MVVNLDISLPELEGLPASTVTSLFAEMLRSSREGHHRIVIPREICRWAARELRLSMPDLAHLDRLRAEYAELGALLQEAEVFSQIVVGTELIIRGGGRIIEIGHEKLLNGRFLEPTSLLLENAVNDGQMLDEIFRHETKRISFGKVNFLTANGGGSGAAAELRRLVSQDRFVVCVCDTDQIVPGGERSATCNAIIKEAENLVVPGLIASTPGREIENFLPVEVIDILYGKSRPNACSSLKGIFVTQGDDGSNNCVWLFIDLKEGLKKGQLTAVCNNLEKLRWAEHKYRVAKCDLNNVEIEGLGGDILRRYFDSPAARAEFFRFCRSKYWSVHFGAWVGRVLWALCAREVARAG